MQSGTHSVGQVGAIPKITPDSSQAVAVREHLAQIISSAPFKGTRRSQEFLQHIVETALQGNFDRLKERVLGVELFGRLASYDTGEDAIVRVTASDLRKRLHQFYAEAGADSELRIDLPSGSYVPEFRHIPRQAAAPSAVSSPKTQVPAVQRRIPRWALYVAVAAAVCVGLGGWRSREWSEARRFSPDRVQPWVSMLQANRPVRIIFCDPEILHLQNLLDYQLSLFNYANRHYLPDTPDQGFDGQRLMEVMQGSTVASVDATIAMSINKLASKVGRTVETRTARSVQAADFKTDDNFILLGSPRSNPWAALFEDKLDFKFVRDGTTKREFIQNSRVQAGESSRYLPTPAGWGNGEAYGILAFIANPGQNGRILLMAGSNREATEATGKLATNLELLTRTLKGHGIDPYGSTLSFEILLRVATMAGSPRALEVIACHPLRTS